MNLENRRNGVVFIDPDKLEREARKFFCRSLTPRERVKLYESVAIKASALARGWTVQETIRKIEELGGRVSAGVKFGLIRSDSSRKTNPLS